MRRFRIRVVLILACLLPFLRLGIGEVQAWDESLYTIRADACLTFGAWLDQTPYAVGHLYSATHPPFGVWLIALSKSLLGDSTFAVRLPGAIAACFTIVLLFAFVKRLASEQAAILGAVSLSCADLFLLYSHRAQMESFILCFAIASIYALWSAIIYGRWYSVLFSAVFLGLGLLTKFAVVLFALPIFLLLPWMLGKPRAIVTSFQIILIALVIAAPWFLFMMHAHPDYWQHVGESFNTLTTGTYKPSRLSWWYYINRLMVGLPLIALTLAILANRSLVRNKAIIVSIVWLIAVIVILQLVGTRMPHFATLLLLPGALLVGLIWNERVAMPRLHRIAAYAVLLFFIAWSASEQIRLLLTGRLSWQAFIVAPGGILVALIILTIGVFVFQNADRLHRSTIVFAFLLLAIAYCHIFSEQQAVYNNGASQVAKIIKQMPAKTKLVVIHPNYPHEVYAPQLAYYTHGWTLGWDPSKTSKTVMVDTATRINPDGQRDIVVIVRNVDRFNVSQPPSSELTILDSTLRKSLQDRQEYRSYILYY